MATHKSAEKRSRQNEKSRLRNSAVKSRMKTGIKSVLRAVDLKDRESSQAAMVNIVPLIERAATKGILHKKTASRKISRLTRKINALEGATK